MRLASPSRIEFGREVCNDLACAERREWLVTNGLGGFASGTVAGVLTRRYHGLLFAALRPPSARTLLFSKIDESVEVGSTRFELATNRWRDDYIAPRGYLNVEKFYLDGTAPVWHLACGDALIEKRVWMEYGANRTYVVYRVLRGDAVCLECRCFANYRDYHSSTHAGDWRMRVDGVTSGVRVSAFEGATPIWIQCDRGTVTPDHVWYRDFVLAVERERGLDDREDHLSVALIRAVLHAGESLTVTAFAQLDPNAPIDVPFVFAQRRRRDAEVLSAWSGQAACATSPEWVHRLVLAADQFIVSRKPDHPGDSESPSVIAGYHWFGEWGRDTMIALPGLTLTSGNPGAAREILLAWSRIVDDGMLPNFLPDHAERPEYNAADAALWFVEAVARYVEMTNDREALAALYPVLTDIIAHYRDGTRYGIRLDAADGLMAAGEPGVQVTWMDAKIGDWVVTPRIGKPVEINALWYNATRRMRELAKIVDNGDASEYDRLSALARTGFDRFWRDDLAYCADVLDGPDGDDVSMRPNQLFAVSLRHSPLAPKRRRAVVDACARFLLTPTGLRSLAPFDERYAPVYSGSARDRDAAYHQGTAWVWLLGNFVLANARVYRDAARARSFLAPLANALGDYGLGTLCEITDGAPPYTARGCIAQAWSVAEVLRAWSEADLYAALPD